MFLICSYKLGYILVVFNKISEFFFSVFLYFELKFSLEGYLFYPCVNHTTRSSHPWEVIIGSYFRSWKALAFCSYSIIFTVANHI